MKQILNRRQVTMIVWALLIAVLLGIIKWMLYRWPAPYSLFSRNVIANMQVLILAGVIFIIVLQLVCKKLTGHHLRVAFATMIYLVILLFGELLCAWLLHNPKYIPPALKTALQEYYLAYGRNQVHFHPLTSRYDSALTYTLARDTNFQFNNYEFRTSFRTNHIGLRDDEQSLISPAVICLGDSHTMGWGVEQKETFGEVLEATTGLRVLTAGISSYGTAREILSLKRMDISNLKYLVIQYCINDQVENSIFIDSSFVLQIMDKRRYDSVTRALQWNLQYYPLKHVLTVARLFCYQLFKPAEQMPPSTDKFFFKRLATDFMAIIRHAQLPADVKIIVLDISDTNRPDPAFIDELQQQIDAKSSGPAMYTIDISRHLVRDDFFLLDGHTKAEGHKKIAYLIAKKIQELKSTR